MSRNGCSVVSLCYSYRATLQPKKLELELNQITFEARKIALIPDSRKTQHHRDDEKELVEKCMQLVAAKNEIDNEIDEIDDEILRQRELHARQMEQNIIEQKSKGTLR